MPDLLSMLYLVITSLLWALSFGIVKGELQGVDPVALSVFRMALSLLVFLPLLKLKKIPLWAGVRLAAIGALQFGLMYILYLKAFSHLAAYEVALFTIFTPLYMVLMDALIERYWTWRFLGAALLAALGAAIVKDPTTLTPSHLEGFLLVQGSNLCFALGQLLWRKEHLRLASLAKDSELFAITYAGALLITGISSAFTTDWLLVTLTGRQALFILYLGTVASGLCFFLWNLGAEKVNAGLLAVMNNGKIPIAVLVSLLVFKEQAKIPNLLLGGSVIGSGIWLAGAIKRKKQDAH